MSLISKSERHNTNSSQITFYLILRIKETVTVLLNCLFIKMLQNSTNMDVLRDNNKQFIVEDMEYMGGKPQLRIFLDDKNCLKHIHTAYKCFKQ